MILLSSDAISLMTVSLPPDHARLVYYTSTYAPGATGTYAVTAEYAFGTVPSASAAFVEDTRVFHLKFALNEASNSIDRGGPAVRENKRKVLRHLLGAAVVPNPGNAAVTISVPSKKEGDCKIEDIDAAAIALIPALSGTIV